MWVGSVYSILFYSEVPVVVQELALADCLPERLIPLLEHRELAVHLITLRREGGDALLADVVQLLLVAGDGRRLDRRGDRLSR